MMSDENKAANIVEIVAYVSLFFSLLSITPGACGVAGYNWMIVFWAFFNAWTRNEKSSIALLYFAPISVIFDIIYLAVIGSVCTTGGPAFGLAMNVFNMFTKCALAFFLFMLHKAIGGNLNIVNVYKNGPASPTAYNNMDGRQGAASGGATAGGSAYAGASASGGASTSYQAPVSYQESNA